MIDRVTSFAAATVCWRSWMTVYEQIGRQKLLSVDVSGDVPRFAFRDFGRLDPQHRDMVRYLLSSSSAAIDALIWSEILTSGAKLFRPTDEQAATLCQVEIPLEASQYQQPFRALTIEYPPAWRAAQRCPGTRVEAGHVTQLEVEPVATTVYRDPQGPVFVSTILDQRYTLTRTLSDPGRKIEDCLDVLVQLDEPRLAVGDSEEQLSRRCTRLALNCGLLLAAFGSRSLGPSNPSHAARLDRQVTRRLKDWQAARLERSLVAELVTLDREVDLYRTTSSRAAGEASGSDAEARSKVRPHWRRGHWRTQHHGPARSLTRPVFIAPVLVNRDLLPADWRPGMTVYRTP